MIRSAIICAFAGCCLIASVAAYAATPAACSAPEYRQFDFFVGHWDAYDADAPDKLVARNDVKIVLDGCVIYEDYKQDDGLHGESYSLYDSARGVWHQSWVTNHGQLLLMDGGLRDDAMTFEGEQKGKDGKPVRLRAVWKPQGKNVRETATRSSDGGKTWQPLFDILFEPHRG